MRSWQQQSRQFRGRPWADVRSFLAPLAEHEPQFGHLVEIIDSVLASGRADDLLVTTSMHDLIVRAAPQPDPPFDVVAVRSPSSLHPPASGQVVIEHLTTTGRDDRIERPAEDAVRLFWRFMIEKFGIAPLAV